jgi:hypothetical protein
VQQQYDAVGKRQEYALFYGRPAYGEAGLHPPPVDLEGIHIPATEKTNPPVFKLNFHRCPAEVAVTQRLSRGVPDGSLENWGKSAEGLDSTATQSVENCDFSDALRIWMVKDS